MTGKKKQHYVPQFYLKNFGKGNGIFVFDKQSKIVYGSNVSDVAQERYFYAIPNERGESGGKHSNLELINSVEDYLSEIDHRSNRAIASLLRNIESSRVISRSGFPTYSLSENDRINLSVFIVFQDLRTREFREKIAQMEYFFTKTIMKRVIEFKHPDKKKYLEKMDIYIHEYREILRHLSLITDHGFINKLVNFALSKHWVIGYNQTEIPLITSDHPVVMRSHNDHPWLRSAAWGVPKTEILIPLSPKVSLMLMCKSFFNDSHGSVLAEQHTENRVVPLNKDNIIYNNHLQITGSYQRLFSNTDEFYLAEDILAEEPKYSNPNRKRVVASEKSNLPSNWAVRHKINGNEIP
ncbi:DUF4238 domain-containing protein [Bdellovibrio reynosensis]|uniref:DUF4238 domain-containing protein n=1 Tax=Bdellovibrio reynosensis TaxID=2835041 RepID=A0ABY4CCV8_9BACT|nr:DUF4238 domain-containing protein [Bdellovibrio reynosensis]UOF01501.1 DUF4238 domain-containing protein [Bdellovibrio reynosensis]